MSPKVRLLALVGLGVAIALGAGMLLFGNKQSSSSAAVPKIHPLYAHRHHARPHRVTTPKPVARRVAKARPTHVGHTPALVNGMPAALASALSTHRVVVAMLYLPKSGVDDLTLDEARAGAEASGAGFVAVNVLKERQTRALTDLLAAQSPNDKLLDAPAVLVFQQPKNLFIRLNGYSDRDTVAQAVQNAFASSAAG